MPTDSTFEPVATGIQLLGLKMPVCWKPCLFDLVADARQKDGSAILFELEDVLSNSIRLSERIRLRVDDIQGTLDVLYSQHVGAGG